MTNIKNFFTEFLCILILFTLFVPYDNLTKSYLNFNFTLGLSQDIDIEINGNEELEAFCANGNSDGNSWETAFLIENYTLENGADIQNTNKYLIIRNCIFQSYNSFLRLYSCNNVKVIKCFLYNCRGIIAVLGIDIEIINCSIYEGSTYGYGIYMLSVLYGAIIGCYIETSYYAIS